LYPRYAGGRPPTFTLPQRQQVKKIALSRPQDHNLPFSTWSLTKLAEFLVAEGVVDNISHEGLRDLLRKEGVSFQVIKTFKQSNDPDYEAKKNRVLELYDIADGKAEPAAGDPTVVFCMDEFGPLNLLPRPGKQWAPAVGKQDKGSHDPPLHRLAQPAHRQQGTSCHFTPREGCLMRQVVGGHHRQVRNRRSLFGGRWGFDQSVPRRTSRAARYAVASTSSRLRVAVQGAIVSVQATGAVPSMSTAPVASAALPICTLSSCPNSCVILAKISSSRSDKGMTRPRLCDPARRHDLPGPAWCSLGRNELGLRKTPRSRGRDDSGP
jgi:hypothetical protein